ncbi:hypothetical protein [Enterococcus sp. AZ103]|uniref:hypothetical protein n=1 Tax=Enterococcus sp. AZ103 TaxID=2774628 RepID=UPI003F283ED4
MRFYPIALNIEKIVGEDKLHNPIVEHVFLDSGMGRKGTWTAEEIALDSRIVTKNLQKVITTLSNTSLKKATQLVLKEEEFTIENIKGEDDDRWRIVYVKNYGSD